MYLRIAATLISLFPNLASAGGNEGAFSDPVVANFRLALQEVRSAPTTWYGTLGYGSVRFSETASLTTTDGGRPLNFLLGSTSADHDFSFGLGASRTVHGFSFGAELDYEFADLNSESTQTFRLGGGPITGSPRTAVVNQNARLSNGIRLRAVLGREFGGIVLYGALGVAGAGARLSLNTTVDGGPSRQFETQSEVLLGWHAAVGLEAPVSETMSLRLEYGFTDYGSFSYIVDQTDTDITRHSYGVRSGQIRVAAVMRF